MALFECLSSRAGTLVRRRELFDRLWGALPAGDDNLNRLVAALRRTLVELGVTSVRVETVPATGYVLRLEPDEGDDRRTDIAQAKSEARDSWRLALPEPDHLRIALLERAKQMSSDEAELHGLLALLHRHAAEYAPPAAASEHVRACEVAARRALELDPGQVDGATALISVAPLYGRWFDASRGLEDLCALHPGHPVPENDLSVVEMATGQVSAAKRRRDRLIVTDPLAAHFCYKTVYHHWSVGDRVGMDHAADRAMQLWPSHPAVWTVRFWTFAFTERSGAALAMLGGGGPSGMPHAMMELLRRAVIAGASHDEGVRDQAATLALSVAAGGPAQAIAALFALGLLGRTDEGFAVARSYYLHDGDRPVPLQPGDDHPKLNEQHRRLTQVLFTPVCARMRQDARFIDLCRSIGLTAFWEQSGKSPDYLLADSTSALAEPRPAAPTTEREP